MSLKRQQRSSTSRGQNEVKRSRSNFTIDYILNEATHVHYGGQQRDLVHSNGGQETRHASFGHAHSGGQEAQRAHNGDQVARHAQNGGQQRDLTNSNGGQETQHAQNGLYLTNGTGVRHAHVDEVKSSRPSFTIDYILNKATPTKNGGQQRGLANSNGGQPRGLANGTGVLVTRQAQNGLEFLGHAGTDINGIQEAQHAHNGHAYNGGEPLDLTNSNGVQEAQHARNGLEFLGHVGTDSNEVEVTQHAHNDHAYNGGQPLDLTQNTGYQTVEHARNVEDPYEGCRLLDQSEETQHAPNGHAYIGELEETQHAPNGHAHIGELKLNSKTITVEDLLHDLVNNGRQSLVMKVSPNTPLFWGVSGSVMAGRVKAHDLAILGRQFMHFYLRPSNETLAFLIQSLLNDNNRRTCRFIGDGLKFRITNPSDAFQLYLYYCYVYEDLMPGLKDHSFQDRNGNWKFVFEFVPKERPRKSARRKLNF